MNRSNEACGHSGGGVARGVVTVDTGVEAFAVEVPVRLAEAVVPGVPVDEDCDSVTVLVTVATVSLEVVRVSPFIVVVRSITLVDLIVVVLVALTGAPTITEPP